MFTKVRRNVLKCKGSVKSKKHKSIRHQTQSPFILWNVKVKSSSFLKDIIFHGFRTMTCPGKQRMCIQWILFTVANHSFVKHVSQISQHPNCKFENKHWICSSNISNQEFHAFFLSVSSYLSDLRISFFRFITLHSRLAPGKCMDG